MIVHSSAVMNRQPDIRTEGMPEEMRFLLRDYPRDGWEAHPGFKQATRNWLGAHQMFRRLGDLLRGKTERYIDKSLAADDYAARLAYYGDALVRNLHGHHHFEDHSYFPELSAADPRFEAGLEVLEKDHEALDAVLHDFADTANRVIKLIQLEENQARDQAGRLHGTTETIVAFLSRHLSDEEELAVPIILHHRLRG
jgi:hemerythrin-like domain-containing protein